MIGKVPLSCLVALVAAPTLAATVQLRINGVDVTDHQIAMARQAIAMQMRSGQGADPVVLRHALDQLIGRQLLLDAARAAGVAADQQSAANVIAMQKKQLGGQEAFDKELARAGMTEAEVTQLEQERTMIRTFVEKSITPTIKMTDEEVRAAYDSQPDRFKHPEQARLRMIFVPAQPASDPKAWDAAKAKAEDARKRVLGGEDFAAVVASVSADASKSRGGELGWLSDSALPADMSKSFIALKAGEVSEVTRGPQGFHVFKVEERRAAGMMPFAEVKEYLSRDLRNSRIDDAIRLVIKDRRAKAKIEALDPEIKAALEAPLMPPAQPQAPAPASAHSAPAAAPATSAAPAAKPTNAAKP
jgi:peptidyl-prolyl cis-trans isomerase C